MEKIMKKNGKKRSLVPVILILAIVLVAVAALIIWKRYEYAASESFYDSLRGFLTGRGALA